MAVKKDPRTLELAEPFVSLFPVEPDVLALVKTSMREHGFDITKPILTWRDAFGEKGRTVVVDGHTRLRAALDLKLPEVYATVRKFKSTDEAITAGIGEQVIRRNMNREQIAAYVVSILPLLDEKRGGLRTRTAKQLAALLGVSIPTVDRARGVIGSRNPDLIAKVKNGELSLLAAYDQVTGRVAPPPAYVSRAPLAHTENAARQEIEADDAAPPEEEEVAFSADQRLLDEAYQRTNAKLTKIKVETLRDAVGVRPDEIVSPEQRLKELHDALDFIDLFAGDLRKIALGLTVNAHGLRGTFRISQIQFHPSGAIYALDGTGKKKIDVRDITKVVKLPEALNA